MANILSVQPFSITVSGTASSGLATLSPSITTGTTLIFPAGSITTQTGTGPNTWLGYLQLASTTGVSLTMGHSPGAGLSVTYYGSVVEFNSSVVNSIQYGTITLATVPQLATGSFTLGTAVGANAFLIPLGMGTTTSTEFTWGWSLNQTSGIVYVSAYTSTAANSVSGTFAFVVADLTSAIVSGTQVAVGTGLSLNFSTTTLTISSVPTSATFIIHQGMVASSTITNSTIYYNAELASATGIAFSHQTNASLFGNFYACAVTLNPNMLTSNGVQRGLITLSGGIGSASITTVGTLAVQSSCRWTSTSTSGGGSNRMVGLTLPSTTVVSASAGYSGSVDVTSWEVIDWVAGGATNIFLTTHFPMETLEGEVLAERVWGESLGSLVGFGGAPAESTEGLSGAGRAPVELLTKDAPTTQPPLESTGGLRGTQGVPVESLGSDNTTSRLPLESLSTQTESGRIPGETTGAMLGKGGEPAESKGGLDFSGRGPAETLGSLAGAERAWADLLGSVGDATYSFFDTTGAQVFTITGRAGLPMESLARVSGGGQLPAELLGVARAIAEAPAEEIAGLSAYLGLPIDTTRASSNLLAYAALALESLGNLAAQAGAPAETLSTRLIQHNPSRTYYVRSTANLWALVQIAKIVRDESFRH